MSRIGNLPIKIPKGVSVKEDKNMLNVEGPKGILTQKFNTLLELAVGDEDVVISRKNETKSAKAYHGLYRKLLSNMVEGVSKGFSKVLLINGVGYRAEVQGNSLVLNLGFSNPVEYMIPEGITVTCEGQNKVTVEGIDKQQVGQVSAEIRSIRPPEPYKGKGVKYEDEYVRRKVGKAGIK